MGKKAVIARAKVVQPRFAIGCACKAVFRAFAIAGKQIVARAALSRQFVALVLPEGKLSLAPHQVRNALARNVAQFVLRKHKVVARVHVAVPFHHTRMTTSRGHGTKSGGLTHPVGQR